MQALTLSTRSIRRGLVLPIALALALSAGVGQAATTAQADRAASAQALEQTTVHHLGWVDPAIAAMVERSGQALVDVLQRADQALAGQEPVLAAANLAYAGKIAQAIELQTPYVEIRDRLETAKGKLEAGVSDDFVDALAPIYASIDDLVLVAPEMGGQVKGKVEQAEGLAKAGKQAEAVKQLDAVVDNITAIRVYIPIDYVQGQIDVARKALARSDLKAAEGGVQKALDSLMVVVSGGTVGGTMELGTPAIGK